MVRVTRHTSKRGALFTDAGSTKGRIIDLIEGRLPDGIDFVGSHPLAGSEKKGPAFADAELFQDRWTVVTPTPHTNAAALQSIIEFWTALGSKHSDGIFSFGTGTGADKAKDAVKALFDNPLIEGGEVFGKAEAILSALLSRRLVSRWHGEYFLTAEGKALQDEVIAELRAEVKRK